MSPAIPQAIQNALLLWLDFVCRKAIAIVLAATLITIALLYYSITQIGISTDTTDMLSPDLPFRQNSIALSNAFPQFSDNIVAVIDGNNADQVNVSADQFVDQLRKQTDLFGEVFDPAGLSFFRQNGLLYLSEAKLANLSDRLIAAQPFLGTLWKNPTLPGLFDLLSLFLKEGASNQDLLGPAAPMINRIAAVMAAQTEKKSKNLSWRSVLSGENAKRAIRVIVIQPKTDFGSLQPGEDAIDSLRNLAVQLKFEERFGTRLRLTGSVPLAEEELASVIDGLGLAGILSLCLVLVLLFWGLKSAKLVFVTLVTLLFGLVWTAGFATFAVGTLNLISVAFAVLFIGLSVDFGIHFALRYLGHLNEGDQSLMALKAAAQKVGGALTLSAIAAAIGFFSFLPTDYIGLAELGLIAGGGMFIALFANLTLLPALITLMPPSQATAVQTPAVQMPAPHRHHLILGITVVLAIASLYLAPKVVFDFDPLNLKDTKTESVSTFFDLMATGTGNPYSITVLAKNLEAANLIAAAAKKLPLVDSTITLSSLIPDNQGDKLAAIENLALILGPALTGAINSSNSTETERLGATVKLQNEIRSFPKSNSSLSKTVQKFGSALNTLLTSSDPDRALAQLETRLLASLPAQLQFLNLSLNAEEITRQDIPKSLRSRKIAADGRAKVEITPTGNMRNRDELAAFVKTVRKIAPTATGTPVVILEAGTTVVEAFIQAASLTLILIAILVVISTRSLREIILIFAPLFLAALFTLAASVLLNLPFNFANVIVLPLLFGLGIAGSIHLVLRDREKGQDVMASSTPRAIVFSALTTIGSFGSIALSSHPGTSSMGVLLTIAIVLSLLSTLVVLPAMLKVWPQAGAK